MEVTYEYWIAIIAIVSIMAIIRKIAILVTVQGSKLPKNSAYP